MEVYIPNMEKEIMSKKRVAIVGLLPSVIDFKDPAYASVSGLTAEAIQSGLDHDKDTLNSMGYDAELVLTTADVQSASAVLTNALKSESWDCIMVGAGVRLISANFLLFEAFVNIIHEFAPQARICFNTKPTDTAEAVERWIKLA